MRNLIRCTIISISLVAFPPVHAQPDSLWSRSYGRFDDDYCSSIIQTSDGGFALAGSSGQDAWLVRVDSGGDSLWSRTYGFDDTEESCESLQLTADGGFILAGYTWDVGNSYPDLWMVKTNGSGDSLWNRTYGSESTWDGCTSILAAADGGYVLLGQTVFPTTSDFWLIKTNANGDSMWSRTYGGNALYAVGRSAHQTADGGYVLGGNAISLDGSGYWMVKTNANGDSLWSRGFSRDSLDVCHSLQQTADGGYILAGQSGPMLGADKDLWIIKTDAQGDSVWSRALGGDSTDCCYSVLQTADGGYVMAGNTRSFGAGRADFWLVKVGADGDSLWSRSFGGSGGETCYSVLQVADGGFALAGHTFSFSHSFHDFWLVRTGPDPTIDTDDRFIPHPSSFILSAYPNPFNPSTTLSFDLSQAGPVSLVAYDIQGRVVSTLLDQMLAPGSHKIEFDGSALPSGVYFTRLQAGEFVKTKKVLLLK